LGPKLTDSVDDLTVADFDGNGRADVATSSCGSAFNCVWKVSYNGTDLSWSKLRDADQPLIGTAAIGRFDGNAGSDVLFWPLHPNITLTYLAMSAGGTGNPVLH